MDKPKQIEIRRDDETISIRIGRRTVASANHDEHGWAGIELIENMAKEVGIALGLPVVEK